MSTPLRITASSCLLFLVSGCGTTPTGYSDYVPAESLRVGEVIYVATRAQIVSPSEAGAYKAIRASGIADSDLVDGSIVFVRIYCCGGYSEKSRRDNADSRVLYVPKSPKLELGDFVEYKVGRPPENNDGGRFNTVTRVVAKQGDKPESCWWDPRNPRLWQRVAYCEWMSKEGWVKQGGISPAWYKPAR